MAFTVAGLVGSWSCAWVSAARVLGWVSGECGRQGKTLTEGGSCVGLAGRSPRAPCSHALLLPAAKGWSPEREEERRKERGAKKKRGNSHKKQKKKKKKK